MYVYVKQERNTERNESLNAFSMCSNALNMHIRKQEQKNAKENEREREIQCIWFSKYIECEYIKTLNTERTIEERERSVYNAL